MIEKLGCEYGVPVTYANNIDTYTTCDEPVCCKYYFKYGGSMLLCEEHMKHVHVIEKDEK